MVKDNLKFWADLAEPGSIFDQELIRQRLSVNENLFEAFLPLLEWIEEGSATVYSLSALGMVYWEAFRSMNCDLTLEPSKVKNRKGCHFRDDRYPGGFKEYVEKFYNAFPDFVSECHSVTYRGQAAIKIRFYGRENRIVGEFGRAQAAGHEILRTGELLASLWTETNLAQGLR